MHETDEEPLPPCEEHEQAVRTASAEATAAKSSLEELSRQQQALQQEAEVAPKAEVARLQRELAELEPRLLESRDAASRARGELKTARQSLELERGLKFVRIQSVRNVEQSRLLASAYANAQADASDELARRHAERIETQRQRQRERAAATQKRAHLLTAVNFENSCRGREEGWRNAWHGHQPFKTLAKLTPPPSWAKSSPDLLASFGAKPKPAADNEPLELLKKRLAESLTRVIDMFRKWDVNCDGEVSAEELRMALRALDIPHNDRTLDELVLQLDTDRSGVIDFHELNEALRKHAPPAVAAVNPITLEPPVRREPDADGSAAERRAEKALRLALQTRLQKVAELFASWDIDDNGLISKREMKRALAALCIPCDEVAIDALFRKLDADHSGGIDFKELNKVLRREFSILEPLVEARVISTGGGAGGAAGLSRPTTTFSGARGPSQLRPKTTPFGERGLQSRSGPKRTESKRSVFERRMQKYSETNLREIMKEKDFNEVAEKRRAATSMPRSRTLPNL